MASGDKSARSDVLGGVVHVMSEPFGHRRFGRCVCVSGEFDARRELSKFRLTKKPNKIAWNVALSFDHSAIVCQCFPNHKMCCDRRILL